MELRQENFVRAPNRIFSYAMHDADHPHLGFIFFRQEKILTPVSAIYLISYISVTKARALDFYASQSHNKVWVSRIR